MLTRRATLALGGGGLAAATVFGGATTPPLAPVAPTGLRRHAAARGMSFGTMVRATEIAAGGAPLSVLAAEADMVVPGIELKWGETEKHRGAPNYAAAETIAAWAAGHGLKMRGHTAFWYRNIPAWVVPILAGPDFRSAILARVSDIVGHFRGRIVEWDVVNEAIAPENQLPGGFRRAPFGQWVDPGWIADCFHAAHEADPRARLIYNDYGMENDAPNDAARRAAVLALLTDLTKRGAPVHGLGLQTHIGVAQRFNATIYRTFLADVAALGLVMRLTEFDINDKKAPTDIAMRDQGIADRAAQLLAVAFDEPAVLGLVTWGLSDAESDFPKIPEAARADGQLQRPLPLDDQWRRKPLWAAIARAYDAAPQRTVGARRADGGHR